MITIYLQCFTSYIILVSNFSIIYHNDLEISKIFTEFALKHKAILLKLVIKSQSGIDF